MSSDPVRVIFETAAIQDALKKASQVAPKRGEAFDKAAGILLTVYPESNQITVQATNLDVFYMEWVSTVSVEGVDGPDPVKWRVPATQVAAVVGSFPIGSGSEVTFLQEAGTKTLRIIRGKTRSSFQLIDATYYPEWDVFDPDELFEVEDFGARIAQVEWACADERDTAFSGINITGDYAQATDKYRAARVPLKVDMSYTDAESLTIPARILSSIMRQTGIVSVGTTETQLLIMPSEHVQIRATLYGLPYPSLGKITSNMYDHKIQARKASLLEVLNRVMLMAGADRMPLMKLFVGKGEIAAMMADEEIGHLGDILEVPGYANHDRYTILFTPKNFIEAIDKCPSEMVNFYYDPTNPMRIVKVDDGAGYEAWIVARREMSASSDG